MKQITKKIQKTEEYFVQFTDEELELLNIQQGDKFSVHVEDEGIFLEKFGSLELDISEFSKEALIMLVSESIEKDISVNEVISNMLEEVCKDSKDKQSYLDKIDEQDRNLLKND